MLSTSIFHRKLTFHVMLIKIFPLILPLALSLVENNFHRLISFFTFQAHHFILQTTTHICMMAYMNLDMETHSNNAMLEKNGLKTRVKKYQGMNFKNYLTFCQIFWFNFKFLNNFHKNDLFEVLFFHVSHICERTEFYDLCRPFSWLSYIETERIRRSERG